MSNENTITIKMTGRRPVRINTEQWPVVSRGSAANWDNEYEFQANRKWRATCTVREHADGRIIVSGSTTLDTAFPAERDIRIHAGQFGDSIDEAADLIEEVAEALLEGVEEAGGNHDLSLLIREAAREARDELPAEEL